MKWQDSTKVTITQKLHRIRNWWEFQNNVERNVHYRNDWKPQNRKFDKKFVGSCDRRRIEHALDDFGRAIINKENLPLILHELAQAPTKYLDALDIEIIGNLMDSTVLCDLTLFSQGWLYLIWVTKVAFETVHLNIGMQYNLQKPNNCLSS